MKTYTIDTNAGPILTRQFENDEEVKAFMIRCCPIANRRGYTVRWKFSAPYWNVMNVKNTKGVLVHSAAFKVKH